MKRRTLLWCLAGSTARWGSAAADGMTPRALQFPADFGAHPQTHTEWWYVTGTLQADQRTWGFQVTFFRSATGLAADNASRFAATQLVFAHAALTDLQAGKLVHDQRIARTGFDIAIAAEGDTQVALRDWSLRREGPLAASRYHAQVASTGRNADPGGAGFALDLTLATTQPLLLQGDAGLSRKGPHAAQASFYYSEPQLAVQGTLTQRGRATPVRGTAWLDHEWSDSLMGNDAVGWDWIGMNLADGGALTAFRLRRADGSALYAGGSFRASGQASRSFGPDEVRFTPGRIWQSTTSRGRYPVEWAIDTPAGRFKVKALLDDQELDSRGSTGAIYWEGVSDLFDDADRQIGRGYLELTGYAAALRL